MEKFFKKVKDPSSSQTILEHIYINFLFTASDFKTIVIPNTIFGLCGCLSRSLFSTNSHPTVEHAISRTPLTFVWIWLNLLPFNINNQNHPRSILEDLANKPWRPLPSKLLTPEVAMIMMRIYYLIAIIASVFLGGLQQCIGLIFLGYWYNNQGGSDGNFFIRNLINAGGYLCFITGAIDVINGGLMESLSQKGRLWFVVVAIVIFTTVQVQDMADQVGDSLCGRKTVPLVLGDRNARLTIIATVAFWSLLVPAFWDAGIPGYTGPVIIGGIVVMRVSMYNTQTEDRLTFKLWNFWIVSLYMQPLITQESSRIFEK